MKRIYIVAPFVELANDGSNSRFIYIARRLKDEGMDVKIITSSFSHLKKKPKKLEEIKKLKLGIPIVFLKERGYRTNISVKRIKSHKDLAKSFLKYIEKEQEKPDIIYNAVPTLLLAGACVGYCKENGIKFIVDVQDLWPEAFKLAYNIPLIYKPLEKIADYIYKNADGAVAVSKTYLDRAIRVGGQEGIVSYLGTDLKQIDEISPNEKNGKIKVAYIGTLGISYELSVIMEAVEFINDDNVEFVIMGDGPYIDTFKKVAETKKANIRFTGRLPYEDMIAELKSCDIAVNPIAKGAAQSIINKVCDYAAVGLPVVSTQDNEEYRDMVEKYNIGYNCTHSSFEVAYRLKELIDNKDLREKMGANNRKLAVEKFNRDDNYNKLIEYIKGF